MTLAISPNLGADEVWCADDALVVACGGAPNPAQELQPALLSAAQLAALTPAAAARLAFLLCDARTPPHLRVSVGRALSRHAAASSRHRLRAPLVVDALCAVAKDCNFAAPPKGAPESVTRANMVSLLVAVP